MNELHEFDKLIRERFTDFSAEPPPENWEVVKEKAGIRSTSGKGNSNTRWLLLLLLSVIPASLIFLLLKNNEPDGNGRGNASTIQNLAVVKTHTIDTRLIADESITNLLVYQGASFDPSSFSGSSNNNTLDANSQNTGLSNNSSSNIDKNNSLNKSGHTEEIIKTEVDSHITQTEDNDGLLTKNDFSGEISAGNNLSAENSGPEETSIDLQTAEINTYKSLTEFPGTETDTIQITATEDHPQRTDWIINASFWPEYNLNQSDNNSISYGGEISGGCKYDGWLFMTGIGISKNTGKSEYFMTYKNYEVVDTWEDVLFYDIDSTLVDSVWYLKPHFYTATVDIYDSVSHQQIVSTKDSYTYLHFPLYIGYQWRKLHRFSISLKTGGIYSVLVGKDEQQANIPGIEASSIHTQKLNGNRRNDYWNLFVGLAGTYYINHRIGITLEPTLRYYLNTPIESNSKNPFTLGIKTGLNITF